MYQVKTNSPPNTMSGSDIPSSTTGDVSALKKNIEKIPPATIRIPPTSSCRHVIYTNINKRSHGNVFGRFCINPLPRSSAPESNAKLNQKIEIMSNTARKK